MLPPDGKNLSTVAVILKLGFHAASTKRDIKNMITQFTA